MIRASLIVGGIREAATVGREPGLRTGAAAAELGRLDDAALAIDGDRFVFVGPERQLVREVRLRAAGRRIEASGAVALPGFVDAHTHAIFAGDRSSEVGQKLRGRTYREIAQDGGGIFATVRATRAASDELLLRGATARLGELARTGVTSAEVKSGYALDHDGELRMLRLVPRLARRSRLRLVPTYLGAHATPPEFAERPDAYVRQMVERTIPAIQSAGLAAFVDAFCEPGFFSVLQSERLLREATRRELGTKLHADEFVRSGGAQLAARLGCRSADHLLATNADDHRALAEAGVAAVLLPLTPVASLSELRSPGRALVDAGAGVALGSDLSPNSHVTDFGAVLSHAVYGARLTPAEAIVAATVNSAWAIGLDGGRLAAGLRADVALFDVPTLEHVAYRFGARPSQVIAGGRPISRGNSDLTFK